MPSRSGRSWVDIRVNAEYRYNGKTIAANRAIQSIVRGYPARVTEKYRNEFEKIAEGAAEIVRDQIITDTNTKKYEKTGERGRIGETGDMLKLVGKRKERDNGKSVAWKIGWPSGKPGYAIFQEQGTRYVTGMKALLLASEWMRYQINQLRKNGVSRAPTTYTYTEWDTSNRGQFDES